MRWDTFLGRVADEGRAESLFGDESRSGVRAPVGAIVAVTHGGRERTLAAPGSAAAAVWELAGRHDLDPRYPEAVLDEVAAWEAAPGTDDPGLVDRRGTPFVTIDGASARDLDQAIFVETHERGWRIHYALADAAFYAPPGSALFAEALRRGASYYLPDRVVPMLPTALSEGLVSLNPAVERRAVIFELTLGPDGALEETTVHRGLIRSRAKLSFESVQSYYDGEDHRFEKALASSLDALRAVGLARMELAEERDIVRYRRTAVRIGTEDPLGFVTREDLRKDVERYNEQVSLLCNVAGAQRCVRARGTEGSSRSSECTRRPPAAGSRTSNASSPHWPKPTTSTPAPGAGPGGEARSRASSTTCPPRARRDASPPPSTGRP